MNVLLQKLGPLAAAVLAVTWCSWEYVAVDAPLDLGDNAVPRLDAARLDPVVPQPSARNPLLPVERSRGGNAAEAGDLAHTPATARAATAETTAVEGPQRSAPLGPKELAEAFKLQGTMVSGRSKNAFINGVLCFEGQPVSLPNIEIGGPCTLARVECDHVVLETADREILLSYDGATLKDRKGPANATASSLFGALQRLFAGPSP